MAWITAVSDLRTLLSDGPTDRYSSRKRCFGEVNGTNSVFKTFEFRRITDFTVSTFPQCVYVDGTVIPASGIASDFQATGEFVINLPYIPVDGDIVEASYYSQWFIDSELSEFLTTASNWLSSQIDFSLLSNGLWPCALKYAAAEAYLKMAIRWRTFLSEGYRVEDEPKKPGTGAADEYVKMAELFRKEATQARDEFYTRQGRNLQPLFGSLLGNVRPMPGGT